MSEDDQMHEHISKDRIFFIDQQKVVLHDFDAPGYILDIGGGGEGVIGKLKCMRVIAIDTRKEELEGTPEGPLKLVMDARNLQFLDNTFDTTTSFFTLMYVEKANREKILREVYRVLKPNGEFLIWDVVIPPRDDNPKEFFAVRLVVVVHGEEIETGYGVPWKDREQDVSYYADLAEKIGFDVLSKEEHDQTYFLKLKKWGKLSIKGLTKNYIKIDE